MIQHEFIDLFGRLWWITNITTAAIICGIFVVLGAFISGTGASQTLGKLGSVNAIGGSFIAALSAGVTVYWMTKLGLPVSTSQTIIGSIVGWNLFSDMPLCFGVVFPFRIRITCIHSEK